MGRGFAPDAKCIGILFRLIDALYQMVDSWEAGFGEMRRYVSDEIGGDIPAGIAGEGHKGPDPVFCLHNKNPIIISDYMIFIIKRRRTSQKE